MSRAHRPRFSAVIPTVGRSPHLKECVQALRNDLAGDVEIVLVSQGSCSAPAARGAQALVDRILELPENRGFAAATNAGLAVSRGELLVLLNDDVIVQPPWAAPLSALLESRSRAGCVQGLNLSLAEPERIDGAGIAFNRWWQAVQIGHGEPVASAAREPVEIFGVSATAALFRRRALEQVTSGCGVFDCRLVSYYEDVDLACRLQAAGSSAWLEPRARARHAGSASAGLLGTRRTVLLYGNRLAVVAGCSGPRFPLLLPLLLTRDLLDLRRGMSRPPLPAVARGWARGLRMSLAFLKDPRRRPPRSQLRRLRARPLAIGALASR